MEPSDAAANDDVLPPVDPHIVNRIAFAGVGLASSAFAIGLVQMAAGELPWVVTSLRVFLALMGVLVAGYALTLRPASWISWGIAAITTLIASVGLPDSWDSIQMLFRLLTILAAAGTVLMLLPMTARLTLISCAVLFHFGGILTATTWPDPAPWLTNQIGQRVYQPYLTFMYLKNAYHFYSPEPGPASHLFALVTYELDEIDPNTGKKKIVREWKTMPRRDGEQLRDPLSQTYYRRLSLTEMASQTVPALMTTQNLETEDVKARRLAVFSMPDPSRCNEPVNMQYRIPQPHLYRYLIPSYIRHMAQAYSAPDSKVIGIKLYRVEHRIITSTAFVKGLSPYHPTTYKPYYFGEYTPEGKLIDTQDPMLYWLVPVLPKPNGAAPGDPEQIDYDDHMSRHAGFEFNWRALKDWRN